jgi:chemotaxis protein CheD
VDSDVVNVGVAEYFVTHNPHVLASFGLGSCVGVALYDEKKNIGGLAHIMLPDSTAMTRKGKPGRYADTAIEAMVAEMERLGSNRRDIKARIAGGACLGMQIGERNIEATRDALKKLKIPIAAEDTGGDYGRTLRFNISDGSVTISSIKHGAKEL